LDLIGNGPLSCGRVKEPTVRGGSRRLAKLLRTDRRKSNAMNAVQRALFPNRPWPVEEFFTDATVEKLNAELTRRDISPEQVMSILPVPAQGIINPTPRRFRVLYRAN
jgi:hypothetical protein